MIRWISDFVCSGVSKNAARLEAEARAKYLRLTALVCCFWIWFSGLLALLSVAAAVFMVLSGLDVLRKIGYGASFLSAAAGFVIFNRCFLAAFRYASKAAKLERKNEALLAL